MAQTDNLFRQTFQNSPIGMVILDAEARVRDANEAFCRIVGMPADHLRGLDAVRLTHRDDASRYAELLAHLRDGALPFFQAQTRLLHRTGDTVWARATTTRVRDDEAGAAFVVQVEDVTEVRRARDLLQRRAQYDHLTGLPQRALLLELMNAALARHVERDTTVVCLFMDIDQVRRVNDSWGHEAGDALLKELARRIRAAARSGDIVARLGGDEFVVVAEDLPSQQAAEALATVITESLQAPFTVEGHEVVPSVTAGLAMARTGESAETLLRHADLAMSAAKRAGRHSIQVFEDDLREEALVRLSVEAELRAALREGQLVVHYQPVVDLESRRPVAFEALVRWQHPERGLLHPRDFIDVCEEANLVIPLGAFVLDQACRFLAERPDFTGKVFVNVSTRQIGDAELANTVRTALEATGVRPDRLGLEITESGMLLATQAAHADLTALADLGVDLIIDDFGTGYSALSSVLLNPVAGVKLAREFTLRLGDGGTGDRISTAMATLVESLEMYGVIEGVETEAQYRQARRHGWGLGQGYLFGHPVPAQAVSAHGVVADDVDAARE